MTSPFSLPRPPMCYSNRSPISRDKCDFILLLPAGDSVRMEVGEGLEEGQFREKSNGRRIL